MKKTKKSAFIEPPPLRPTYMDFRHLVWQRGGFPFAMAVSGDVCGLTLVARWVRTKDLIRVPDGMSADEASKLRFEDFK